MKIKGSVLFVNAAIVGLLCASSIAHASGGRWDKRNNPSRWDSQLVYDFDRLPLEGAMETHTPWSDTYWPKREAGIAARWNLPGSNGFTYRLLPESEVRGLSEEELKKLSPAEKYDIFMGRFDYPTVRRIRNSTSPRDEEWAGICHGWSPAALNHAEPMPVIVTGNSGISVPFGSADVKALLDQYYADHSQSTQFLGGRCRSGSGGGFLNAILSPFRSRASCNDVNAGAFHLVLTNQLGIRHQGFVADVDQRREVWNQPVFEFHSQIVGYRHRSSDSAPGTVQVVVIQTQMRYTDEIDASWDRVVGTSDFKSEVKEYKYTVELDASGRIIGGQWISGGHPDFLWNAPRLEFNGYFEGLNRIYQAAPTSHI